MNAQGCVTATLYKNLLSWTKVMAPELQTPASSRRAWSFSRRPPNIGLDAEVPPTAVALPEVTTAMLKLYRLTSGTPRPGGLLLGWPAGAFPGQYSKLSGFVSKNPATVFSCHSGGGP